MKGDYSRFTFNPANRYSAVLMQQGRVQTDADFNEQQDITQYRIETEIKDFIGRCGVPETSPGFAITIDDSDLIVGKGRCYVDGVLFENNEDVSYAKQPDLPGCSIPQTQGMYAAYIDVWQRHISALEDSDIRDDALGNQDTAARKKNLWQVKLIRVGEGDMAVDDDFLAQFDPQGDWTPNAQNTENTPPLSTGMMSARVLGSGDNLKNQLYRVEVHRTGTGENATFKWSRENACVAAEIVSISDYTVALQYIGRGLETGFAAGDWIEITNDNLELNGLPGVIVKIGVINGDEAELLIDALTESERETWYSQIAGVSDLQDVHTKARRWDSEGHIGISDLWTAIENDIQIKFDIKDDQDNDLTFNSGDFWLIPSRSVTRRIYWPQDAEGDPISQAAAGTLHKYCCLFMLRYLDQAWSIVKDFRTIFKGIAIKQKEEEEETGGSGSFGDIEIDSLSVGNIVTIGKDSQTDVSVNGILTAETLLSRTVRASKLLLDGEEVDFSNASASDRRLKVEVKNIKGVLDKLGDISGVYFKWNRNYDKVKSLPTGTQIGLIADQVETQFPELVTVDKDGFKQMQYANFTAVLLEAIKELSDKVKELEEMLV